ncbi:MAG: hypothetical protein L0L79_09620, partial [Lentilactobacillus parabuchneri]|nr:hypothetical protein [Lentilactobacillus parabuchneri]MDN6597237.1 hypothetical protein [Lentilactobacillus parabuchneri]MDN6787841.1 hypothetical protein [Lentilactobacillus parabuchneri]
KLIFFVRTAFGLILQSTKRRRWILSINTKYHRAVKTLLIRGGTSGVGVAAMRLAKAMVRESGLPE